MHILFRRGLDENEGGEVMDFFMAWEAEVSLPDLNKILSDKGFITALCHLEYLLL